MAHFNTTFMLDKPPVVTAQVYEQNTGYKVALLIGGEYHHDLSLFFASASDFKIFCDRINDAAMEVE